MKSLFLHVSLLSTVILGVISVPGASQAHADILSEARTFLPDPRNTDTENWEGPHVREIMNEDDWKQVLEASETKPVFVFKHSTECPISAGAAYRTNAWLKKAHKDDPKIYFVKVIERKPVSQKIEAEVKVKHESPQLLLLKDGKSVWNTSHASITADAITEAIRKHAKTVSKKSDGSDSK